MKGFIWRTWVATGRAAYIFGWPLLFLLIRSRPRTRVVVVYQGKILAVKGWLGSGKWVLPGGGLHVGENAAVGAAREVLEETGLRLAPESLTWLGKYTTKQGMRFEYDLYSIELTALPVAHPRGIAGIEITQCEWLDPNTLCSIRSAEPATYNSVLVWLGKNHLLN